MGKAPKGSSSNSTTAKAGKKHGNITYPAPISPERRAGKDGGEQQFVAKETLTHRSEKTIIVFDKQLGQYVYNTKTINTPVEFAFDASRGRVISSPKFKEAQGR